MFYVVDHNGYTADLERMSPGKDDKRIRVDINTLYHFDPYKNKKPERS